MARSDSGNASSRALDEAIAWHVKIGEADEKAWAEFTEWLEADPANRLAFDRVEDIDRELDSYDEIPDDDVADMPPMAGHLQRIAPWLAAAGVAASLILGFVVFTRAPAPVEYATAIGQSRTIMLADGSRIDLNTATKLLVDMRSARRVTLEKGEALFHVAKDASHPFIVAAGDRNVRVVGTVFDVLRSARMLTVVVAEGRVRVSPKGAGLEIALQPGDKLTHSETTGTTQIEKVDPAQALAWRRGYLVYRNAPLSSVVSDLNRYFPVPIVPDARAADERFTGVLRIDSQDAVLSRISQFLPVKVVRGTNGKITLQATAARP